MAKTLYQWEVTHKKQMADGTVKEIKLKQKGPKPPKGARNIEPLGQAAPPADITAPAEVDLQAVDRPPVDRPAKKRG